MEHIYHEKQVGYLCGLHCLNNLLQSRYFTELDLAEIAQQIDQQERSRMAEGAEGVESEEYQKFLQEKSRNIDDSGFFSIEVILRALKVWNLDVINYNSSHEIAIRARQDPTVATAYICNFKEHWFTIRKIGKQYFNLNSLLSFPELLSESYIHLFLAQLQQEGYSIFIVTGTLPQCEADTILSNRIVTQSNKPHIITDKTKAATVKKSGEMGSSSTLSDDDGILQAIQQSLLQSNQDDDKHLQQAISLSMQDACASSLFQKKELKKESPVSSLDDLTEEQLLAKAISMSLEKE